MSGELCALVSGASGLLGTCLTRALNERAVRVLGQYHRHAIAASALLSPVCGDLSTAEGLESFWLANHRDLLQVDYFFSNYGPLTYKKTEELEYGDFQADFCAHLAPLVTLAGRMRSQGRLSGVMVSGLAEAGPGRAYRYILTQACAKTAAEMVIESWKLVWPELTALYWPVPPLRGARFPHPGVSEQDPADVAAAMVRALLTKTGVQ